MPRPRFTRPNLGTLQLIITFTVFIAVGSALIIGYRSHERKEALSFAEREARIIFNHYYSDKRFEYVHAAVENRFLNKTFTQQNDSLALFPVEPFQVSFPAGKGFSRSESEDYYFKISAVDAKNPVNQADSLEKKFIEKAQLDPGLQEQTGIMEVNKAPNYFLLSRGRTVTLRCLRCHGDPSAAPAGLTAVYGSKAGFKWKAGSVTSAISIRVPLPVEFMSVNKESIQQIILLLGVLGAVLMLVHWINNRLIVKPIAKFSDSVVKLSSNGGSIGMKIDQPISMELSQAAASFNLMSEKLSGTIENLEKQVRERTSELEDSNKNLAGELIEITRIQKEKENLIGDLTEALSQIKTLSGLLPICSSCKKIRDDSGSWSQIEVYLQKHSEAEFSHSVCPECAKKLYPEFYKDKD